MNTSIHNGRDTIDGSLVKKFEKKNFEDAVAFVNKIVPIAEKADHHPDITIHGYNKVTISLRTHDQDAITDKDFDLADKIDKIQL